MAPKVPKSFYERATTIANWKGLGCGCQCRGRNRAPNTQSESPTVRLVTRQRSTTPVFEPFSWIWALARLSVQLIASIRAKGARLAVPGVVDLSDLAAELDGVAKIVLEAAQELLLKLALQMARDDHETRRERQRQGVQFAKAAGKYAGRKADTGTHQHIVALRTAGKTIERTAKLAGCSVSQVKRIRAMHQANGGEG